jgi:hypothetical protein
MNLSHRFSLAANLALCLFLINTVISAQDSKGNKKDLASGGTPIMWEKVDVSQQDTFLGPGGTVMQPDVSNITFIEEETGGHSKKFKIKDAAGNKWVAKIGDESQSETAAVRLLAALGYKTEINYLVPELTIPGKGTFKNVRLEARPDNVKRLGTWSWKDNPFQGRREFQGLKIMMALLNNWDTKEANNVIIRDGDQLQYVISDLGVSFGKSGPVGLPIFWRIGRSRNEPEQYAESDFVKQVKNGSIKFSFSGKNDPMFNNITNADGRWLADLLNQLSDKQIEDAFRAANYSDADIKLLADSVRRRIRALDLATGASSV